MLRLSRLDELSITEDEFAEALNAAEKELVDSYVQGELAGATLERFKSHYLASPIRREQVRFAQAFQLVSKTSGFGAGKVGRKTQEISPTTQKGSWRFLPGFLAPPRPELRWGMTFAILLLVLAVGWFALDNIRRRGQVSQQARTEEPGQPKQESQREIEKVPTLLSETEQDSRAREERERVDRELKRQELERQQLDTKGQVARPGRVGIASFILMPQLRDAGQIREVVLPPGAGTVAIQLVLEPNDFALYRVALINQLDNYTFWRSAILRARTANEDRSLSIRFPARLLKPGTVYLLRVIGVSSSGASDIVGDYPFRVK